MSSPAPPLTPEAISEIAERTSAFLRRGGRTQAWAAREAGEGCSPAAISQFLGGSYKGDTVRLALRLKAVVEREELRERGRAHVPPVATTAVREIRSLIQAAQLDNVCGALIGRPGLGKTTGLQKFDADNPGSCIYTVATIAAASPKSCLGQICEVMRLPTGGTLVELERRIVKVLAGTSRTVIADDAHYLSDRGLLALQGLHERAGVPVILVGNRLDRVLSGPFVHFSARILLRKTLDDTVPRADLQLIARAILRDTSDEIVDHLYRVAQGQYGLRGVVALCRTAQRTVDPGRAISVEDLVSAESFHWGAA